MKNEAKKKYARKCKQKVVTFYKCDEELLKFASSINFQRYVKNCLRYSILKDKLMKSRYKIKRT